MFSKKRVLFLGAHTDDIEHGAGAALLYALDSGCEVRYLTFSRCTNLERNAQIEKDQQEIEWYLRGRGCRVDMMDYPNMELPDYAREVRDHLSLIKESFQPEIVFTHWAGDTHQDHQTVTAECLRTFHTCSILQYEVLRSCPGFVPNIFLPMSEDLLDRKVNLLGLYESQAGLYYNNPGGIRALAVVRGIAVGYSLAEGYAVDRVVL